MALDAAKPKQANPRPLLHLSGRPPRGPVMEKNKMLIEFDEFAAEEGG